MIEEKGIFLLRDIFLGMEKNQPAELRDIYNNYLKEIEADVIEKWENRDKAYIDLRVLKDWNVKNWKSLTQESLAIKLIKNLESKGFIDEPGNMFLQLLTSNVSLFYKKKLKSTIETFS